LTSASHRVGSWHVPERDGGQRGLVLPITYPLRHSPNQNMIATVNAGNVGCAGAQWNQPTANIQQTAIPGVLKTSVEFQ
jgi:hypothetical protein